MHVARYRRVKPARRRARHARHRELSVALPLYARARRPIFAHSASGRDIDAGADVTGSLELAAGAVAVVAER